VTDPEIKRRPGRPATLAREQRKNNNLTFRARPTLKARLVGAAEASDRSVSEEIEHRLEGSFHPIAEAIQNAGVYQSFLQAVALTIREMVDPAPIHGMQPPTPPASETKAFLRAYINGLADRIFSEPGTASDLELEDSHGEGDLKDAAAAQYRRITVDALRAANAQRWTSVKEYLKRIEKLQSRAARHGVVQSRDDLMQMSLDDMLDLGELVDALDVESFGVQDRLEQIDPATAEKFGIDIQQRVEAMRSGRKPEVAGD
jgi:hypothetical protein